MEYKVGDRVLARVLGDALHQVGTICQIDPDSVSLDARYRVTFPEYISFGGFTDRNLSLWVHGDIIPIPPNATAEQVTALSKILSNE